MKHPRICENNVEIGLKEKRCGCGDEIYLVEYLVERLP